MQRTINSFETLLRDKVNYTTLVTLVFDVKKWRSGTKDFVKDACNALQLPPPYPGEMQDLPRRLDAAKDPKEYVLLAGT